VGQFGRRLEEGRHLVCRHDRDVGLEGGLDRRRHRPRRARAIVVGRPPVAGGRAREELEGGESLDAVLAHQAGRIVRGDGAEVRDAVQVGGGAIKVRRQVLAVAAPVRVKLDEPVDKERRKQGDSSDAEQASQQANTGSRPSADPSTGARRQTISLPKGLATAEKRNSKTSPTQQLHTYHVSLESSTSD